MTKKVSQKIFNILLNAFKKKNFFYICGNGGSAAIADHIAGEFVSTFLNKKRKPYPAISLCSNLSTITAIANDFNYKYIFARQLEALGKANDIVILMSTSGKSENIRHAIRKAKDKKIITIGLFGKLKTTITNSCDHSFYFNLNDTARLQEKHLWVLHEVCRLFDKLK